MKKVLANGTLPIVEGRMNLRNDLVPTSSLKDEETGPEVEDTVQVCN